MAAPGGAGGFPGGFPGMGFPGMGAMPPGFDINALQQFMQVGGALVQPAVALLGTWQRGRGLSSCVKVAGGLPAPSGRLEVWARWGGFGG